MKISIYFKNLFLIVGVLTLNQDLTAQESVSKTLKKNVPATDDGTFYMENKYGTITISGWDRDTAEITSNITVSNKQESDATALLARIQSEIKLIGNSIYVESKILDKKGNIFSKYFDKANPLKLDKNNIQIDYTINLPKNMALDLTNKFGDIIVDSFQGELTTELQHGDMWVNSDLENANIHMKFGKLKGNHLANAKVELKNAELLLDSSGKLELISSGSTLNISNLSKLDLYSNKDIVNIKEVEELKVDSKFSEITIEQLLVSSVSTTKVTTLSISEIKNPNPIINITQESSEISINITNTSFNFRAQLTEGVLKIPKTFDQIQTKMIDKSKKTREIQAEYGSPTNGKLNLSGYKGSIILKDSSLAPTN